MAHRLRWRDLAPGLIAAAAIVALGVYVVATGSVTAVHGKTIRIHVAISSARGVTKGSEVWLDGAAVGLVNGVGFAPATSDTAARLVLDIDVRDQFRGKIRSDADVRVQPGASFIGAPVVAISDGTPAGRVIGDGDTLHASAPVSTEELTSKATLAAQQLPAIMGNLKVLAAQLRSTEGTLGALGVEGGGPEAAHLQARLTALTTDLSSGRGTVGLALNSRSGLSARAQHAMAGVDSVRALLASNRSVLGRFRRDSSLLRNVGDLRDELAILQYRLSSPDGTLGRMSKDSAVAIGVADAQREMSQLFADISAHPFRYVRP